MSNLIHISKTDLSDFFKDAYGFRPRSFYIKEYWTETELNTEYQRLSDICKENDIRNDAREKQALSDFEKLVQETINHGAGDRETAIKWLVQGEDLEFHTYDLEYFFWGHGLSYEKQKEFTKKVLDKSI